MGRPESLPLLFQTLECCLCSFFTHCQFPTEVLWDPLHRLSWVANILVTASFYKCSRTNSFWPKLPYDFGVDTTTSGCGRFCPSTYKSNFWALEQALINSIVATSTEHSVHLSIFQLPKRTHFSHSSIWYLFFVAKTSMEVNS